MSRSRQSSRHASTRRRPTTDDRQAGRQAASGREGVQFTQLHRAVGRGRGTATWKSGRTGLRTGANSLDVMLGSRPIAAAPYAGKSGSWKPSIQGHLNGDLGPSLGDVPPQDTPISHRNGIQDPWHPRHHGLVTGGETQQNSASGPAHRAHHIHYGQWEQNLQAQEALGGQRQPVERQSRATSAGASTLCLETRLRTSWLTAPLMPCPDGVRLCWGVP